MKLTRWLNKLYANSHGYFWLPCPLCGEMFGGHEWHTTAPRRASAIMTGWGSGIGVCNNCHGAAQEYNENWKKEHPPKSKGDPNGLPPQSNHHRSRPKTSQ